MITTLSSISVSCLIGYVCLLFLTCGPFGSYIDKNIEFFPLTGKGEEDLGLLEKAFYCPYCRVFHLTNIILPILMVIGIIPMQWSSLLLAPICWFVLSIVSVYLEETIC